MPSGNFILASCFLLLLAVSPILAQDVLAPPPPLWNPPPPPKKALDSLVLPPSSPSRPILIPNPPVPLPPNEPSTQIQPTLVTPQVTFPNNITASSIPLPPTEPPTKPPSLGTSTKTKFPNEQDDNGLPPGSSDPSWVRRCGVVRQRKEYRDLTEDEQERFFSAVQTLMTPSTPGRPSQYDVFVKDHHKYSAYGHKSPAFFPFHRIYIRGFERALQTIDPSVMLPYFDWSIDSQAPEASILFTDAHFGGNGDPNHERCVKTGRFTSYEPYYPVKLLKGRTKRCIRRKFNRGKHVGAFLPIEAIAKIINDAKSFVALSKKVELQPHAAFHNGMGLTFRSMWSPQDVLFFLHHAFIDKIWEDWQKINMAEREFAFDGHYVNKTLAKDSDILMPFRAPIRSGLSNLVQKFCYTYAPASKAYQDKVNVIKKTAPVKRAKMAKKIKKVKVKVVEEEDTGDDEDSEEEEEVRPKKKSKHTKRKTLVKRGTPGPPIPSGAAPPSPTGQVHGKVQYQSTLHTTLTMATPQGMTVKAASASTSSSSPAHPLQSHRHRAPRKAHPPIHSLHSDAAVIEADIPEEHGGGFEEGEEDSDSSSDSHSDSSDEEEEPDHGLIHDMNMEVDEDAEIGDLDDEEEARDNPYVIPSSDRSRLLGTRIPARISPSYAREMGLDKDELAEQEREMRELIISFNRMKGYVSPSSLWNREAALNRMIQGGQSNFTVLLASGKLFNVQADSTSHAKSTGLVRQMKRKVERVQGTRIHVTGQGSSGATRKDKELQRKLQRLIGVSGAKHLTFILSAPRTSKRPSSLMKGSGKQPHPTCRPKKVKKTKCGCVHD